MKHYTCRFCGNLVAMINDTGRNIGCCGKNMTEVVPSAAELRDEKGEKHTPIIENNRGTVRITVGPTGNRHPHTDEHFIGWVCLVTNQGSHRKTLSPDGEDFAEFILSKGERPIAAFAYCNLHGIYVSECKDGCI